MTLQENIFLAKRNIVDYIYKSARLEGINTTFPETYAIYEQARTQGTDTNTIITIINLKTAWKLLLDTTGQPLNLEFLKKLHSEVARNQALAWGTLRTGKVGIGGTAYIPPVPVETETKKQLDEILATHPPLEKALHLMLWCMKKQLFWDGNKRTAMLAANKIMIENGLGIISVPTDKIQEFNTLLSNYYSYDTATPLKTFILKDCIDTIEKDEEKPPRPPAKQNSPEPQPNPKPQPDI
jgi:Fic family protein